MSRPCFALSVMLCCMAGPLLVIGKAHAGDTAVSPGHNPGECIVCPLAHSPLEVCGGYSDYDYNQYWQDSPPPSATEATPEIDPEIEVTQSLSDDSMDAVWEAGYEDYYADYVFGSDSTTSADEDLTLTETLNPVAVEDVATETAAMPEGEATSELYDEYGWYSDEYGYEGTLDEEIAEDSDANEPLEQLATGYDDAYDEAMTTESVATEPIANTAPAIDDYESFYDAYDDLYNFESASLESSEYEASAGAADAMVEDLNERIADSEPAWLKDLVSRMLRPLWTVTDSIASETSILVSHPLATMNVDECAQEWDCESDDWARPQVEQASLALEAADTLDGMASLLQDAADTLRGLARRSVTETARTTQDDSHR
ncbi:MAG: hypothetical protein HYV60_09600 [Planctomycetia bacterium]|nr:hypothetical protein [Planctomycetia bacterium]